MKTYLRLLSYASPLGKFVAPFFLFTLLSIIFGVFQFTLLIPVLNLLFGNVTPEEASQLLVKPAFSFSPDYVKGTFYYYFNQFMVENGRIGALQFVCIIIVLSTVLSNIFRYLAQRVVQDARTYSVQQLRNAAFNKASSLHLGYFSDERKGDLLSRITSDVQEVENTVAVSLDAFFKEPYSLITFFIILFSISAKLTAFTLVIIPIAGLLISTIVKSLRKDAKAGQESISRLMTMIDETLGGMRIIKSFNATGYVQEKFAEESQNYRNLIRKTGNKRELAPPFSEVAGIIVVAGILLYGGSLILQEQSPELKAAEFIVYIGIFSQVIRPVKGIASAISVIQRGIVAGDRVLALIDTPQEVQEKADAVQLEAFSSSIDFKNVSFSYGNTPVLNKINFSIPKGKTIALVGESGGGKSTLADLIPRFYDVSNGCILIDGKDIRDYTLESLRNQMGIVTQKSILFNDTIFNNIAFGNPNASEADVIRAAKIANAHDFIMNTEHGYQTTVGDRGDKLSGGQQQRISIARAVFKNPPILILDEATSALDTEAEKSVQDALNNLMKGRTVLVIAHRLSTIQKADEILVVKSGNIIERGTHDNLLELEDGVYRKLKLLQI
jgi:subfamily B ATP-binding cassette protein MsbA